MTLPLSYSRLRVSRALFRPPIRRAGPPDACSRQPCRTCSDSRPARLVCQPALVVLRHVRPATLRAKVGGEGRTRTFEAARATDLQSAAFDRFATSPACCYVGKRLFRLPATGSSVDGAGEGIRTPDLLITNQLLYRPELRQPRQKVNFSTSRATLQVAAGLGYGRGRARSTGLLTCATTPHCTHFRARCRTASKRATPAATDTFKL